VARNVDLGRDHRAVQAFVKQQVGVVGQLLPLGEGAGLLLVGRGLDRVMQVLAAQPRAGFGVAAEQPLELGEEVVLGPEVAEVLVAAVLGLELARAHLLAVEAVEAVALDHRGGDLLAAKDVLERARDRRGAGAGRSGDRDDGVSLAHVGSSRDQFVA
jgi:hypothetical protein